jgi:thermostable 8-oxoguanine DNA glycosylase
MDLIELIKDVSIKTSHHLDSLERVIMSKEFPDKDTQLKYIENEFIFSKTCILSNLSVLQRMSK